MKKPNKKITITGLTPFLDSYGNPTKPGDYVRLYIEGFPSHRPGSVRYCKVPEKALAVWNNWGGRYELRIPPLDTVAWSSFERVDCIPEPLDQPSPEDDYGYPFSLGGEVAAQPAPKVHKNEILYNLAIALRALTGLELH